MPALNTLLHNNSTKHRSCTEPTSKPSSSTTGTSLLPKALCRDRVSVPKSALPELLKRERAKALARDAGKKRQAQAQQDGDGSGNGGGGGARKLRVGEMRTELSFKDWIKS